MYITKGVTETRVFTRITLKMILKFSLSNRCRTRDDPYCYEVGSHEEGYELLNIVLAKSSGQKITDKIIVISGV